jgi:hypothetical protein
MCSCVRSSCCFCMRCLHRVRRHDAFLSIMSSLTSYTQKKKKKINMLLLAVHHRSRSNRWGCHMLYQSGFNPRLGIAMDFVDMI